jgi:hypothetical protein
MGRFKQVQRQTETRKSKGLAGFLLSNEILKCNTHHQQKKHPDKNLIFQHCSMLFIQYDIICR